MNKNIDRLKIYDLTTIKTHEKFHLIVNEMRELYIKKNNDYGNSVSDTYNKFGDVSFAVRITDKVNRLTTLLENKEQKVQDEKIEDTIIDMVNYGILWLIERETDRLENISKK